VTDPAPKDAAWQQEAAACLARNDRFLEEFVEGLNVCPYAKKARINEAALRRPVPLTLDEVHADAPAISAAFDEVALNPAVEVLQVLCPRVVASPQEWVTCVKGMTEALHAKHGQSVVGVAAFHPDLPFLMRSPAAMVPLFRRAPDPTIQWIRLDVIACVRAGRPAGDVAIQHDHPDIAAFLKEQRRPRLDEEIASANARMVQSEGLSGVLALLAGLRK
jgi:hypothetical protein